MTEYSAPVHELVFDNIKVDYAAHDKTCSSIPHIWLGFHGGRSCFGEQAECDGCQVVFYWEGLNEGGTRLDEDGDEIDAYYCDCCRRRLKNDYLI